MPKHTVAKRALNRRKRKKVVKANPKMNKGKKK